MYRAAEHQERLRVANSKRKNSLQNAMMPKVLTRQRESSSGGEQRELTFHGLFCCSRDELARAPRRCRLLAIQHRAHMPKGESSLRSDCQPRFAMSDNGCRPQSLMSGLRTAHDRLVRIGRECRCLGCEACCAWPYA